jgi:hypothetical protein
VLRAWRMQTIANDTGRIRLQCLDGGGVCSTTIDDTASRTCRRSTSGCAGG